MFVLDEIYASDEVLEFLETSQEPVLNNEAARALAAKGTRLNLVPAEEAACGRIVCTSEMHLSDFTCHCNANLAQAIALCKNKAALRRAIAPLYPNYLFLEATLEELPAIDAASLTYPLVLKPSVGFFSLGIYPVFNEADWRSALASIRKQSGEWAAHYNEGVVNNASFIAEAYLEGQEYALDAYFDENGQAVVLNILQHDFAGAEDTSDRLYYTSERIIREQLAPMTKFLDDCNALLGFRDFPTHVEVRVQDDGSIVPIEFNPCRFAGLCSTDLSYFAYGFKTYEYFLRNRRPDWDAMLVGREGVIYPVILLTTRDVPMGAAYDFDYETATAGLSHVLSVRKTDAGQFNSFGFVFAKVREEDWAREVEPLLTDNLRSYLTLKKRSGAPGQ